MLNRPSLCLIAATHMEADPFIKIFDMKEIEKKPFSIYEGKDVLLGISGIGKANAAMGTAFCCIKYKPACILNAGAAGAVDESYQVGNIYQVEKTIEPDRPHLRSNTPWVQTPDIIKGFNNAVLATQDKPVDNVDAFNELSALADMVDMEGASVLQTARRFDVRCYLFKFVSDTPLHAGKGLIVENIREQVGSFCEFVAGSVIQSINKVQ